MNIKVEITPYKVGSFLGYVNVIFDYDAQSKKGQYALSHIKLSNPSDGNENEMIVSYPTIRRNDGMEKEFFHPQKQGSGAFLVQSIAAAYRNCIEHGEKSTEFNNPNIPSMEISSVRCTPYETKTSHGFASVQFADGHYEVDSLKICTNRSGENYVSFPSYERAKRDKETGRLMVNISTGETVKEWEQSFKAISKESNIKIKNEVLQKFDEALAQQQTQNQSASHKTGRSRQ